MSKIIFELVLQDVNAAAAIAKFRQEVKDANAEIKKGVGGDRFKELTEKVAGAKVAISNLTEEQKKLRKEFAATQVPTDSLTGLRIAYSKVTDEVNKLSKAERESQFGKNLVKQGADLKTQINSIEESLGRFTGSVGNYKKGLLGVGDILTGGLATGGIVAAIGAVAGIMKIGEEQAIQYEKALDDLSALTGLKGEALGNLEKLGKDLRNIQVNGVEIINTGPGILNAMKLVGGARPELLNSAEALADVTKQAIILSAASGDTLANSVAALTTELGQFNEPASNAKKIINELAAGAKAGAAEIPDITESLQKFGTIAKISNVTTGESVALIETLAARQLKGAEAGTQLRAVFAKLASADILPPAAQAQFAKLGIDINVLKDATLPLETRLNELGKAQGDLSALTKIFGLENLQAATIITSNLPQYAELKKGIEGTSEAYDQAATRSENLSTKLENLKNGALNELNDKFSTGNFVIGKVVDGFSFLIEKGKLLENLFLGPLVGGFDKFVEGSKSFLQFLGILDKSPTTEGAFFDTSAIKDSTDALLQQVGVLKETGDSADGAKKSISELKREIKDLTRSLGAQTPGTSQFKEIAAQLKEAKKELKDAQLEAGILTEKAGKKPKDVGVAGSLAFLRDEVDKLQKQLDKTPPDSPLFKKLDDSIKSARKNLQVLEAKIQEIQNPTKPQTEVQQAEAGLLTLQAPEKSDVAKLKKELDSIAKDLAISVGVNIQDPTEDEQRRNQITQELNAQQNAIDDKNAEETKKKREDQEKAIKDAALGAAQDIANGVFEIQKNKQEKEKNDALAALDAETKKKVDAAQGNAVLIAKIEKDADKKKAQIEKQAAERAKALALKQAEVDIALSILKALSSAVPPFNFILAAAAAVAGAIQLATIKKQEFAGGGRVKQLGSGIINEQPNHPKTSRGDNVLALVKSGEMILNEEQQRRLEAITGRGIYARIGVPLHGVTSKLVPQFASGGFASDFTPQIALPQVGTGQTIVVQTVAEISDEQMNLLAARIAAQTGRATKEGVGEGLEDNNRLKERQEALTRNREA